MTLHDISDFPGICIGHYTDAENGTGCTVIVCPEGATGAVDVRGGAPATRETDLLRPEETVDVLHAVVLSGGSAFGLAASCGVAEELERRGIGLDVGVTKVPIVSSACLFDLAYKNPHVRPTAQNGADAVACALDTPEKPLSHGCVGAGTGATVGKLKGPECVMKSGLGSAVAEVGPLRVGALAAVNACGNIIDPATGKALAGMKAAPDCDDIVSVADAALAMVGAMPLNLSKDDTTFEAARTNTTISCVVTNAKLTKAQATKVAQMAADAYAHTIVPTHTTNDGDAIFVMATGVVEMPVDVVGMFATQVLEQAIINSVAF